MKQSEALINKIQGISTNYLFITSITGKNTRATLQKKLNIVNEIKTMLDQIIYFVQAYKLKNNAAAPVFLKITTSVYQISCSAETGMNSNSEKISIKKELTKRAYFDGFIKKAINEANINPAKSPVIELIPFK